MDINTIAKLRQLIEYCRGKQTYIQTHNFPDADAIASAFGLQTLFGYFGVSAKLCYVGSIDRLNTRKMTALLGIEIHNREKYDGEMQENDPIICVDSQKGSGNIEDLPGDEIACIDHHPFHEVPGLMFHDVRAVGSCATIITSYFKRLAVPLDPKTATALLYGLKMDTADFRRGVTPEDLDAFKSLFAAYDADILDNLVANNLELKDLHAYGAAIESVNVHQSFGFVHIPFACPDALIAMISDFVLSIEEVNVSIVYSQRPDGWKFSVRSQIPHEVNAGILVRSALEGLGSGGGHPFMAGGMMPLAAVNKLGDAPHKAIMGRFLTSKRC